LFGISERAKCGIQGKANADSGEAEQFLGGPNRGSACSGTFSKAWWLDIAAGLTAPTQNAASDFAAILEQLRRYRNVTLRLLWEEYCASNPVVDWAGDHSDPRARTRVNRDDPSLHARLQGSSVINAVRPAIPATI
jgi:hypothetical protein